MNSPLYAARRLRSILAVLFLSIPLACLADDDVYDFEIVIFERPDGVAEEVWPEEPEQPDPTLAVASLDMIALPASDRSLEPVAYTLKKKGMIVHEHVAFREAPGGRNSNNWLWIDRGRLTGLLRVTRGRYLHLDTDLALQDPDSAQLYRIQLNRRMRSGELHYVDHPLLGIVIKAERHEATAAPDDADAASGEPKPVQPIGAAVPG
jgi:hypothetical protein